MEDKKERDPLDVNDVHSKLNPTRVSRIVTPKALSELQEILSRCRADKLAVCVSGSRHSMGGQQFLSGGLLIDMRALCKVLDFDTEAGIVEVEAGIQWPDLISFLNGSQVEFTESQIGLNEGQGGHSDGWAIAQKQTGADRLTIGGALSSNVHGRGLALKPFISDVESFKLIDGDGKVRTCSRAQNAELFGLAIGGYGLFGVIYSVRLRLVQRQKLRRLVEILEIDHVMPAFECRIADGFTYGDFQFDIDASSEGFLKRGVFSCYEPVNATTPVPEGQAELSEADWRGLIALAHTDKRRAFDTYTGHYLQTNGQIYWSDTHQLSIYVDDYHAEIDDLTGVRATELITELYVPRADLVAFMADVAADFRQHGTDVIYGTVRLIERDDESYLAWAREPFACIIFNLHVVHTGEEKAKAAEAFRRLIDRALERGGSYFLTYHRYARRDQVETAYPQMQDFLKRKQRYDPTGLFQSDWYRHHADLFSSGPSGHDA